jgi:predicted TIM-barrel fold metal-dependent hydrolase
MSTPEYNVTGLDYGQRGHLHADAPPLIDVHAHVMRTRPPDAPADTPGDLAQAEAMLAVAREFGIARIYSMCPVEEIPPLRERFGAMLGFNGSIARKVDDPDDAPARSLERFLEQGVEIIKFWSAPRGRERGLFVDAPWRIDAARRARAAGVRVVMVHVADPDRWFRTAYADVAKFGTKADQYVGLERMLQEFPDMTWIAAHMGGDPEHPDHLEALLERYPHLNYDTSAAKWQVREVSPRRDAIRDLICRKSDRFLFGSDLVTRHGLEREHYVSRYWCHRTLWESNWTGQSPIDDPDYERLENGPATPTLHGLDLPAAVLRKVYRENALRLLPGAHG